MKEFQEMIAVKITGSQALRNFCKQRCKRCSVCSALGESLKKGG